ncbi:MAG: pimeloyl-CoA dehydrogenase small subunit [Gammaproteobacteria bacterium]|nr:pimeloyl-CoA dehydrogenase small subunit [Gammaproteobacteria bacterium]
MNFELSPEQQLIQDSVARFIDDNYALEARQKLVATKTGFSAKYWSTMAELGWLGLTVPENLGGFGGDQVDTMLVMEQFGKGLVLEPFVASTVLGTRAVVLGASQQLQAQLLPGLLDGSRQLALAYAEEQAHFDLEDIVTHAKIDGTNFILNGHKSMVQHGASATQLVVSARTSGGQADTAGITLMLVDTDSEGIKIAGFPTVDGQQAAEVTFDNVRVPKSHLLGSVNEGFDLLMQLAVDGILALSAEAVGAMEVLYKDTVTYTQEREQFGHALSEFQVLQHRMVDMFMEYEQAKSLLYRATLEVAQSGLGALRTVHALKHFVGKIGIMIGENAVQLHGGMGVTEELRIGHYFKRLLVIDALFGNSDYHLQKFAA